MQRLKVICQAWAVGLLTFDDGQRPFLQRLSLPGLPQVPQDMGEVVQVAGDIGVVGSVGGLVDGQGPFLQRPGLPELPQASLRPHTPDGGREGSVQPGTW